MTATVPTSSDTTPHPTAGGLPTPSPAVQSLMDERWHDFDPDWPRFDGWLHDNRAVCGFGHARATFREHLRGTFALCAAWGLPRAASRAGLLHTAYSGDLFFFALARSESSQDRAALQQLIGTDAERLVHQFGALHRGTIMDVIFDTGEIPADGIDVRWNRAADAAIAGSETTRVPALDCALLMLVTVADYLEQAVASNAWKDIYQVDAPSSLWPGSGKPATCMHWVSKLACAARPHLPQGSPVPPIFDGCTTTLSEATETHARDLYWQVVRDEDTDDLSDPERAQRLTAAVRLNPWVGEPHALLAQIAFRAGEYDTSVAECGHALRKLYALGTAWDKRVGFPGWCAFIRGIALRASRRAAGASPANDFPRMPNGLAHIDDMVDEIEALQG